MAVNEIVRSLLIPVNGANLLLPAAVVGEVVPCVALEIIDKQPEWLLGIASWRNQRVPVLNLDKILGVPPIEASKNHRLVVLYGLEVPQMIPFYAITATDTPRTLGISPTMLTSPTETDNSALVFKVQLNAEVEEEAVLMDLTHLENLLRKSISLFATSTFVAV